MTEDWKTGPHQLTYRQTERTFGLVTGVLAKDHQAVVSWPSLQIDADVRSGNPALVAKPGILVSTDDLAIRGNTVKVRAPCGTGMPVMFRIDVSGTAGNGNITARPPRPPRRMLWQWLRRRPRPYALPPGRT